jgi:hypothetical protein
MGRALLLRQLLANAAITAPRLGDLVPLRSTPGLRISFNASSQSTSLPDSVTQKLRRPVARAYWRRQLLANAAIAASRLGSSPHKNANAP